MSTTLAPAPTTGRPTARPAMPAARFADPALGLAILRVTVGLVFVAHGAQKVFVYGVGGTTGAFGGMGVPVPGVSAPLVAAVELLGGLALALGLFTRPAALLLAATMLGAIGFVHLAGGFFLPNGMEYALTLLAAALALAVAGPGAFSLDAARGGRRARA